MSTSCEINNDPKFVVNGIKAGWILKYYSKNFIIFFPIIRINF